jgi:chromosome segregation ATPase
MWILIVIVGIAEALIVGLIVFNRARHLNDDAVFEYETLKDEVQQKRDLWSRVEALRAELGDEKEFTLKAREYISARETLKIERGQAMLSQVELETLEGRLRELEEISRELEASATETKEELKILQRKQDELSSKNAALRGQIADSVSKMEALMAEIEMTAQMQEQVNQMRSELLRSEEKIQTMLNQIQQSNEQYFNLKRRYDALDVEYAQLYQQLNEQMQR